ncbi:MAG: hypothetical protein CMD25_01550 [Flavobacteriales bacterium]|nr:hypothetical protein [Flavobacteriales bacterium]
MRNICILILLLINSKAWSQKISVDTNIIFVGQQVEIKISNNIKNSEFWPNFNDTLVNGLEIVQSDFDTLSEEIIQKIIITSWDSGSYYIPPVKFSATSKSNALIINVLLPNIDANSELKDIKGPLDDNIGWSDIWPWLVLILIILLSIFTYKKYFNKKKKTVVVKKNIQTPAHILALNSLKKLENKKLIDKKDIKEYYSSISEIIRRYIENRFNFPALELTTYEILNIITAIIKKEESISLKNILEISDLVKFAKKIPDQIENVKNLNLATDFVKKTKKEIINE